MNHKYIDKNSFEIVDNVFEVDADIAETISILNKKGYYTKYCCSGHSKDPRLYQLYNMKSNDNIENLGYLVNEKIDSYDVLMPFTHTSVYIMFEKDYNFNNLPFGFYRDNNENVEDYVISMDINYYENSKRKNDLYNEIKEANNRLLEWAISLPDNK